MAHTDSKSSVKAKFHLMLRDCFLFDRDQILFSTKIEKSEFFLKMESFPRGTLNVDTV